MTSCLTCFDKKNARRKLELANSGSTLTLPREEEARLLAQLARGSANPPNGLQTATFTAAAPSTPPARDPHCVVAQDFVAGAPDEISVRRGDCVQELYRDGDWVFVATTGALSGFVPSSYLRPIAQLFSTTNGAAQSHTRRSAKAFDRSSSARASIDSRRSVTSRGSVESFNSGRSRTSAASPAPPVAHPSLMSTSCAVSGRELYLPPRTARSTNGDHRCAGSQPASRTQSPHPLAATSNLLNGETPTRLGGRNLAPSSTSSLPPGSQLTRPTSCSPSRCHRTATLSNGVNTDGDASTVSRCGSAMGWSESQANIDNTQRTRRSLAAPGEAGFSNRRALSLRNVRVANAQRSAPRHVRMAYNFEASNAVEVSVTKGEEVVVVDDDHEWLVIKMKSGQQGRVPKCMTVELSGKAGIPNVNPLSRDLMLNSKSHTGAPPVIRNSVATDITDDSAIATGDELSLSPGNSPRSSVAGFDIAEESLAMNRLEEEARSMTAQFSTLATRGNSPTDTTDQPATTTHTGTSSRRGSPSGLPAQNAKSATLPSANTISSTRAAMLAKIRAREAIGDRQPRLVVVFDYTALVADEMDVQSGDIVLENPDRSKPGWVWATLPRTDQEGYIPHAFTHPYGTDLDDRQLTAL